MDEWIDGWVWETKKVWGVWAEQERGFRRFSSYLQFNEEMWKREMVIIWSLGYQWQSISTCMRHLLSAELWVLNASYLFATMYKDISIGLILLESLSWLLQRDVAASFSAFAAVESVDCSSFNRKSTTFLTSLIHFRREAKHLLGLDKSQQITTADVDRLPTVNGTSSNLGSEISPPSIKNYSLHVAITINFSNFICCDNCLDLPSSQMWATFFACDDDEDEVAFRRAKL